MHRIIFLLLYVVVAVDVHEFHLIIFSHKLITFLSLRQVRILLQLKLSDYRVGEVIMTDIHRHGPSVHLLGYAVHLQLVAALGILLLKIWIVPLQVRLTLH